MQNVRKMIHMIKGEKNNKLPARLRWLQFLGFYWVVNYCVGYTSVVSCLGFARHVSSTTAGIIIVSTVPFNVSIINSASLDRDAASLAPPGSVFGVSLILIYASAAQGFFTFTLSETDLCDRMNEYMWEVTTFFILLAMVMWSALRMLVGKLVDYCELRIELLAISKADESSKLSLDAATELKKLYGELWERSGFGLAVICLGLLPSFCHDARCRGRDASRSST